MFNCDKHLPSLPTLLKKRASAKATTAGKLSTDAPPGEVFQGKALSRSIPAKCEASQQGTQRGKGGAGQGLRMEIRESESISSCRSVLTLSSVCPQFVLTPSLAGNPHGCWVSLICPRCPSVFAIQQPVNVVNGSRMAGAGHRHAARWGSSITSAPLRSLSR